MGKKVHRTARVRIRATAGQRRRCLALMVAAGDVWAWVIDCNRTLRSWGCLPVVNFAALCRELTGTSFGELSRLSAEDVLKRYSAGFYEAAKRRSKGEPAGFPRRKKRLVPVRFRFGQFSIEDRRLRLATAKGAVPLFVRLARDLPYDATELRSVTLVYEAGKLFADVTAELEVEDNDVDPHRIAGVDLGIIHPFAVAGPEDALLVSGRALRAESRLHLDDTKARQRKLAPKQPSRGQQGSRRWKKLRATQRRAEVRHKRRIHQAHHEAAKEVVQWAVTHRIGSLVVGDLRGITQNSTGKRHNLRLRQWRRTHLLKALVDKARRAGIEVILVDERGTSSTCPDCNKRVPKPKGRIFVCSFCKASAHRDIVGARNIAARCGGITSSNALVKHRRVGAPPARRDRRRHLYDERRSCPDPGRPAILGVARRATGEDL